MTTTPSGETIAKALRDAYGQGYNAAVRNPGMYTTTRDAWIRQYLARMPVAVPAGRDGEEVGRADFPGDRFEGDLNLREAALEVVNWFDKDGSVGTLPDYIMDLRSAIKADEVHRSGKLVLASGSGKEKILGETHKGSGSCLRSNPSVSSLPAFDPSRTAAPFSRDEIVVLLDECKGWHASLEHGAVSDGAFTVRSATGQGSDEIRRNLRAWMRDISTVLTGILSADCHKVLSRVSDRSGEAVETTGSTEGESTADLSATPEPSPQSSPTLKTGGMTVEEATPCPLSFEPGAYDFASSVASKVAALPWAWAETGDEQDERYSAVQTIVDEELRSLAKDSTLQGEAQ